MVDAGQDFELRTGDVLGQAPRLGDRNEFVRPVQHQGGYAQAFEQPLGAAIGERADHVPDHGRAGGGSLQGRGNPAGLGICSQARRKRVERPPRSPALKDQVQFRPGFGGRRANGRAVQHKTGYPVNDSEADGQRASLAEAQRDRCPGRAGGSDRRQVLNSLADRRRRDRRIGQASSELVITDQPAMPGQPAHEPPVPRQLPLQFEVRMHAGSHQQIHRPGTRHLIRQRAPRPGCVAGRRRAGHPSMMRQHPDVIGAPALTNAQNRLIPRAATKRSPRLPLTRPVTPIDRRSRVGGRGRCARPAGRPGSRRSPHRRGVPGSL